MASRSCNRLVHQTQGLLTWKLPCICHGSADDPKENATGPLSTFVFDAV
ncbi:hypothetical protein T02_14529 [Trichinella nativa]|uniref:Uncharacterized protein n=1 Tax=Trichinella nativa TaxID=6335 RepID=A0A0V1KT09_9BILA|nr:hypothetical protein T06_3348 [Trichinella sp. T6]KRZ50448.1 hypothetical protein T02_16377 [Trichinella nativa]KRX42906.1 hypothetical protein T06_5207 [Trichinella sp. T6]KRX70335.1 hypothetical protein T06_4090 [Trichinella sp. T6]KRZ54304.1 hypothetical protein T02_15556 [Trichinella nativa]